MIKFLILAWRAIRGIVWNLVAGSSVHTFVGSTVVVSLSNPSCPVFVQYPRTISIMETNQFHLDVAHRSSEEDEPSSTLDPIISHFITMHYILGFTISLYILNIYIYIPIFADWNPLSNPPFSLSSAVPRPQAFWPCCWVSACGITPRFRGGAGPHWSTVVARGMDHMQPEKCPNKKDIFVFAYSKKWYIGRRKIM